MPDLSQLGAQAGAIAVALGAIELAKLALARRARNGEAAHGATVEHHMGELAACQEAAATHQEKAAEALGKVVALLERVLERLDREVIPAVSTTKHTVGNAALGVQAIGGDLRELEGAVGRLVGQVGDLARRKTGD